MKNLFLALSLTAFVGAASVSTLMAFAPSTVIVAGGGEECEKGKKCKKGDACCKSKTASKDAKKSCSSNESGKKCCSSSKASTASADSVKVK